GDWAAASCKCLRALGWPKLIQTRPSRTTTALGRWAIRSSHASVLATLETGAGLATVARGLASSSPEHAPSSTHSRTAASSTSRLGLPGLTSDTYRRQPRDDQAEHRQPPGPGPESQIAGRQQRAAARGLQPGDRAEAAEHGRDPGPAEPEVAALSAAATMIEGDQDQARRDHRCGQ